MTANTVLDSYRSLLGHDGGPSCSPGSAADRRSVPGRRFREEQCKDDVPVGRLARFHKPLQTAKQRRDADVAAAHAHFCRLGWEPAEVHAGQMDRQLDALLARACAMQAHAKHLENLLEHARAYHAAPTFMCVTFCVILHAAPTFMVFTFCVILLT